jgi:anti-sigma B factor antagonist
MRIEIRTQHSVVIIQPKEPIAIETEAQFTAVIGRLLEGGRRRLVLDLEEVPYIDSLGLGAIVHAYVSSRRLGGDLKLLHVKRRNRQVLAITKLLTVLETYDTEDEVEGSFAAECEESMSSPS